MERVRLMRGRPRSPARMSGAFPPNAVSTARRWLTGYADILICSTLRIQAGDLFSMDVQSSCRDFSHRRRARQNAVASE